VRHLLIDDVDSAAATASHAALARLPNLGRLLKCMRLESRQHCPPDGASSPHELALARAHGLSAEPGRIPWAAFETQTIGVPCAWLTPAHLRLGMDNAQLLPPQELQLTEAQSRALLAACAPLLAETGIRLDYAAPTRWLAQGDALADLTSRAPERAARQRRLTRAQLAQAPTPGQRRQWMLLGSELEMLLATHPVNQARSAQRLWPVNAVWLWGAGALPRPHPPAPGVMVAPHRAQARALPHPDPSDDALAHAWRRIDADCIPALLAAQRAGCSVRITLSGQQSGITLRSAAPGLRGWLQNWPNPWRGHTLPHWLEQIAPKTSLD
jgi:hypothetical protein